MPRYFSRCPNLLIPLIDERKELRHIGNGQWKAELLEQQFDIEFRTGAFRSQDEINAAMDYFFPLDGGFRRHSGDRAMPMTHGGIFEGTVREVYEPHDPRSTIGAFDTDDPDFCPPQYRERAIEKLELHAGIEYFRFEVKREIPWPSYDELKGGGVAKQVGDLVAQLGIDPAIVINYELAREGGPRESVVTAMSEQIAERERQASDLSNLTVTV